MSYQPYPQFPGSEALPVKSPAPRTVQRAFILMLVGAGLAVLAIPVGLVQTGSIRSRLHNKFPNDSATQVNNLVHASIVSGIVVGLIGAGLWIWMAYANRAGHNWARILSTVFFGISTLSGLASIAVGATVGGVGPTPIADVLSIAGWLVGLGAVILLWHKQSSPYFKHFPEYATVPYPMPYPAPGQAPYPGPPPVESYPQQPPQDPPTQP